MKIMLTRFFILGSLVTLSPVSLSAFSMEDLTEALRFTRACPVAQDDVASDFSDN